MKSPTVVFILDIDGVLIQPMGYRSAMFSTLHFYTRQMGLDDRILPDEDIIALFETQRITSEWDMVPISLAIILNTIASENPGLVIPDSLSQISIVQPKIKPLDIDYRRPILKLGEHIQPGKFPSAIALALSKNGFDDHHAKNNHASKILSLYFHSWQTNRSWKNCLPKHGMSFYRRLHASSNITVWDTKLMKALIIFPTKLLHPAF